MTERYRLMAAEKGSFPVPLMARALGVSRSGFYSWLRRGGASGEDPWAAAREAVCAEHASRGGVPGARTLRALVAPRFPGITLYRVRTLMRELGIRGVHPRVSKRTTVPDPAAKARPDLVRRDFDRPVPTCWLVGDITYLGTGEGWLYMAVAIDLATRMAVGLGGVSMVLSTVELRTPRHAGAGPASEAAAKPAFRRLSPPGTAPRRA